MAEQRLTGNARNLQRTQKRFQKDYEGIARSVTDRIRNALVAIADEDGIIQPQRRREAQRVVRERTFRLFVNENGEPFGPNGISPLAPYPEVLNAALATGQMRAIELQGKFMERNLPTDLLEWLRQGVDREDDVVATFESRSEYLLRTYRYIFVRSEMLGYDPAHRFADPRGYRLSDRIWQTANRARDKMDRIVTQGIQEGVGALEISRRLERSLQPSRANLRTSGSRIITTGRERRIQRLWWGRRASYDAMRLGRTEITAAIGRSQIAAARANPYIDKMAWTLSPSHPVVDVCDGLQDRSPYDLNNVPPYPAHVQCLCFLTPVRTRPLSHIHRELREALQLNQTGDRRFTPLLNPAAPNLFADFLLGELATQAFGILI